MTKKHLYIALTTLFLLSVDLLAAAGYMLHISLQPANRGRQIGSSYDYMFATYPHLRPWVDSLRHTHALRDTFITAPDGARLHALYIRAAQATPQTAVIVHGYTDNAVRMLMIAHLYSHTLGYNVLLPDLRNAGLSEGNHFQMGWADRSDIRLWQTVANATFGSRTRQVLHGISMGAAAVMMTASDNPLPYLHAVIEDCGYTSVWDEFEHRLRIDFQLPAFPLMHVTSALCKGLYGWSFSEADALTPLRSCRLPMLFIHSDADTYVPTPMVYRLYAAKPAPKAIFITRGSQHAMSYRDHREAYTAAVRNFLQTYMPAR